MGINWYPGHMAKTRRLMADDIKNIDMVCEILDARIPLSSRNPDLDAIVGGKRRMIALNRADLAEPSLTAQWMKYYTDLGHTVIATDSRQGGFIAAFTAAAKHGCADLIARNRAKGLVNKRIRIMIFGVPNVGKSTFINRLLGRKSAVAANKPGVTRARHWYSLPDGFDFMDTPGMLWPKIEDDRIGYLLAFTGTIRDEILDLEDLACHLISALEDAAPHSLTQRYGIESVQWEEPYAVLEALARARGFLQSRGNVDTLRMSRILLDEFRGGKLGRITLERPAGGDGS